MRVSNTELLILGSQLQIMRGLHMLLTYAAPERDHKARDLMGENVKALTEIIGDLRCELVASSKLD